ncbi:MAG: alkaline phosphatase family protein [Candidatus Aminicenantales bacterium]
MKFIKVLANSIVSALFFAGLLALLTLDINIDVPFDPVAFGELALALAVPYGPIVILLSVLLFFIVQFFLGRRFPIRAISPSFLSLSFAVLIFVFLFIFWENHRYFLSFFDKTTETLLRNQVVLLAALGVLAVGAFYVSLRYRKKVLPFAPFFTIFALGMTLVATQRARFPRPGPKTASGRLESRMVDKNIVLIGLEGLSFDFIIPLISEGKLPNFAWLIENGSWGRLRNFSPCESFILNHTLLSGKLPPKHRQLSTTSYRLLFGKSRLDVTPRFILFRQMIRLGLLKAEPRMPAPLTMDLSRILEANGLSTLNPGTSPIPGGATPDLRPEKSFNTFFKREPEDRDRLLGIARSAFVGDWKNEEAAFSEKSLRHPAFFHLLLNGLNTVEAYFYKYSFPELFGSIDQEEINRYGPVIARYYEYYDQMIGKYLASLKDDEILVVYSPYGVESLPLWKRFVEWILGNADISAYHEDMPDGVVFFLGSGIAKGNNVEGIKVEDIAPTLLYCLGLPLGRDMDGIVQSPVFIKDFTDENPIFYISSYEEFEIRKR